MQATGTTSSLMMDSNMAPNVFAPSASNDASRKVENLDKKQESHH